MGGGRGDYHFGGGGEFCVKSIFLMGCLGVQTDGGRANDSWP